MDIWNGLNDQVVAATNGDMETGLYEQTINNTTKYNTHTHHPNNWQQIRTHLHSFMAFP